MIAAEVQNEIKQVAEQLYAQGTDWVTFYREILSTKGIVRRRFPTLEQFAIFEQTEAYQDLLLLLTELRKKSPLEMEGAEPTRVITVRLPKSMHETLRDEAFDRHTSMNKLCISKLLQSIDEDKVPTER